MVGVWLGGGVVEELLVKSGEGSRVQGVVGGAAFQHAPKLLRLVLQHVRELGLEGGFAGAAGLAICCPRELGGWGTFAVCASCFDVSLTFFAASVIEPGSQRLTPFVRVGGAGEGNLADDANFFSFG